MSFGNIFFLYNYMHIIEATIQRVICKLNWKKFVGIERLLWIQAFLWNYIADCTLLQFNFWFQLKFEYMVMNH